MRTVRILACSVVLMLTPLGTGWPRAQDQATPPAPRQGLPSSLATALPSGQARQYTGAPIDVDYQQADLREVLRSIADFGGINLVIDPSVATNAKVDLSLKQVPWDQVLDLVIRTNQLRWEVVGNVVRVVSAETAQKEFDSTQREIEARADADAHAAVRPASFVLNYAKGEDIEKILKASVLSKWGDTNFDPRTNSLIVRDLPEQLQVAQDLIHRLDLPEPQVEIEARIVETDRQSAKSLGIQWGVTGQASAALGNTTSLGFPNSAAVTGVAQDTSGKAATVGASGSVVNLPAQSGTITPSTGIGLSLGAVNGAFNLDAQLTALEHAGRTKILSSPKVTTQNNVPAEVTQGTTVPYQATSNNTVTVQFRDAALNLKVTPHITAANTVVMDVSLENGAPDFGNTVNGNPSIKTQKATTKVMVADGVTTVIGGIVVNQEFSDNDKTPGLGSIPLLGWLFKRYDKSTTNQEILIFITPRIIRGVS